MQKKLQIKVCIKTLNNYFQFLFQTLGKNCSSESVPFKLDLLANISTKQFKSLSLCGFNAKTPRMWVRIWRNPSWMSTSRGVCDVYTFFIKMFSTFPYCFNGSWSWLYSMIRWVWLMNQNQSGQNLLVLMGLFVLFSIVVSSLYPCSFLPHHTKETRSWTFRC